MPIDPHLEREARTDRDARRELVRQLRRAGDPRGELLDLITRGDRRLRYNELLRIVRAQPPETRDAVAAWIEPWLQGRSLPQPWHGRVVDLDGGTEDPALARLVRVHRTSPIWATHLFEQPNLRLTRLDVSHGPSPVTGGVTLASRQVVDALLAWPGAPRLRRLRLAWCHIASDVLCALFASPALDGLHTLELVGQPLDGESARLLRSRRAPGLQRLVVTNAEQSYVAGTSLCTTLCAPRLRTLDLRSCGLRVDAIRRLVREPALVGLRALDLSNNDLPTDAAEALAASPHMAGLQTLRLCGNRIGRRGLDAMLGPDSQLRALRVLDLSRNGIEDGPLDTTRPLGRAPTLEVLRLRHNRGRDTLLAALAAHPALVRLRDFDYGHNAHTPESGRILGASTVLGNLRRLWLCGHEREHAPGLGDEGVAHLAASTTLAELRWLDLHFARASAAGLRKLRTASGLPRLKAVRVGEQRPDVLSYEETRCAHGGRPIVFEFRNHELITRVPW